MSDRIYFKAYNTFTKEYAILPIAKDVDRKIVSKMFYEEYGKDGWLLVEPLSTRKEEE